MPICNGNQTLTAPAPTSRPARKSSNHNLTKCKMTRVLFLFAAWSLCLAPFSVSTVAETTKPNVIYIMADDLGYGELGCFGQTRIKTPEIDKLAQRGMRFTQHYAGTSVCAPTRCSLMTGLHTGHTYIRANSPGYPNAQTPIPEGTETVGKLMQRAGYRTACIGKWGLGNFDNVGAANKQGFDHFFGYYDQRHAHNYFTKHLYRNSEKIPLDGKTYSHDLLTKEALRFMEDHKDKPFFLYLPYCIPHTKFQVPELGKYSDKEWKKNHKIHAAMISRMDRDIGTLVRKMEELEISKNTLIMFTSDHGAHGQSGTSAFFNSSGKLRGIKRSMYEGGIRVPLIATWPDTIPANSTSNHISAFWDMMPTLAELVGEKPRAKHDGISFLPELLGKTGEQQKHDHLYWELFESGRANRAVRRGRWKGVIANLLVNEQMELYDLESDPGETKNVADKHPELVTELTQIMKSARVRSKIWNIESRGFNLEEACKATGITVPRKSKKNKSKKQATKN